MLRGEIEHSQLSGTQVSGDLSGVLAIHNPHEPVQHGASRLLVSW